MHLFVFILYTLFNTLIVLVKLQLAEICGLYFLLHKICFSFSLNSVPKNHCEIHKHTLPIIGGILLLAALHDMENVVVVCSLTSF
jgi:hypothetical protein